MKQRFCIIAMAAGLILGMVNGFATAADFPTRPITIVCPVAPGGSHDTIGRMFAAEAEKYMGQPFVFSNKPGGKWVLGTQEVLKAEPDGYTIGMDARSTGAAVAWEISKKKKPPYTRDDMISLGALTMSPILIIASNKLPWDTLDDMAKAYKAQPDKYVFCSGGLYGGSHIPGHLFAKELGVSLRHVPYKGGGPCISAVIGGHADWGTQFAGGTVPLYKAKKLRILAVMNDKRLGSVPDVPTTKELGYKSTFAQWVGLFAPAKTPKDRIAKLRDTLKKVSEDKKFISMVEAQGEKVHFTSGDEMDKLWRDDYEMWLDMYKNL